MGRILLKGSETTVPLVAAASSLVKRLLFVSLIQALLIVLLLSLRLEVELPLAPLLLWRIPLSS